MRTTHLHRTRVPARRLHSLLHHAPQQQQRRPCRPYRRVLRRRRLQRYRALCRCPQRRSSQRPPPSLPLRPSAWPGAAQSSSRSAAFLLGAPRSEENLQREESVQRCLAATARRKGVRLLG
jgi:hypothetical protein